MTHSSKFRLFKPKIEIRSMTSNAYFQLFMQQRPPKAEKHAEEHSSSPKQNLSELLDSHRTAKKNGLKK
jgi:hypothetical protein